MNDKLKQLEIIILKNAEYQIKFHGDIMPWNQSYQTPLDGLDAKQRYRKNHPDFIKYLNDKYYNSDYQKAYYRNHVKLSCDLCGEIHSKYCKCKSS